MEINRLDELTGLIQNWADARNIYHPTDGGTMTSQLYKLMEEAGETYGAIVKRKDDEIKDGIGDVKVCLINVLEIAKRNGMDNVSALSFKDHVMLGLIADIGKIAEAILTKDSDNSLVAIGESIDQSLSELASEEGLTYEECLEQAYDDIKDRKGTMINRCFVKESDLKPEIGGELMELGDIKINWNDDDVILKKIEFIKTIGAMPMYEGAVSSVEYLRSQLDPSEAMLEAIEDKFKTFYALPEADKAEFIEGATILGFDDYFDKYFEGAEEFKTKREALLDEFNKLTEKSVKLVSSEKHIGDDKNYTAEYVEIINAVNDSKDALTAHCAPIMPFGELYRNYVEKKIF